MIYIHNQNRICIFQLFLRGKLTQKNRINCQTGELNLPVLDENLLYFRVVTYQVIDFNIIHRNYYQYNLGADKFSEYFAIKC